MKLIVIHGPPAAGKLTVANALAEKTNFKVFHNHLTIDCIRPVIDFGTEAFWRLSVKIRCDVIAEAARNDINVIQTFVYGKGEDEQYFADIIAAAEENGGEVHIVLLRCENEERKRRMVDESRIRLGKLTDPNSDDTAHLRVDVSSPLPGREKETLVIDTTNVSPEEASELIIERFGLSNPLSDSDPATPTHP
jgi:hypothetical protein